MNLVLIFLLICTGVKGYEEEIPRIFTNGHGGFQFYHAQEKYEKPHKPKSTTPATPQEDLSPSTTPTNDILTNPTRGLGIVNDGISATTAASVRRIVSDGLRRGASIETSTSGETTERTTRITNFVRRRRPTTSTENSTPLVLTTTTVRPRSTSPNSLEDLEGNKILATDLVGTSSATETSLELSTKLSRFYKKERTTTEENNEVLDVTTKKFAPKTYYSNFKLRRPTIRPTTEKTNPKIKRHDVHVLNANSILEKRRKIYQGYIRKPPTITSPNSFSESSKTKIPATINRKPMPKISFGGKNVTSAMKTNSTVGKNLYARRPSEKYMQLRQKEKPKVEAGISALRKRHLSSVNYFRQHSLKFS